LPQVARVDYAQDLAHSREAVSIYRGSARTPESMAVLACLNSLIKAHAEQQSCQIDSG
jgi:hypothetical protein